MHKIDYVLELLNTTIQKNLDFISGGLYQAQFTSQKMDSKGKRLLDSIELNFADQYKAIPIELASGGQRAQVSVSVICSVFEVARKLTSKSVSSLWLDEVLGPVSEDVIDRVFEALLKLSAKLGADSIKMVSHRSLDERLFDHVWTTSLVGGITQIELN